MRVKSCSELLTLISHLNSRVTRQAPTTKPHPPHTLMWHNFKPDRHLVTARCMAGISAPWNPLPKFPFRLHGCYMLVSDRRFCLVCRFLNETNLLHSRWLIWCFNGSRRVRGLNHLSVWNRGRAQPPEIPRIRLLLLQPFVSTHGSSVSETLYVSAKCDKSFTVCSGCESIWSIRIHFLVLKETFGPPPPTMWQMLDAVR